jgi:ABC-type multidrug transport system permease subunit
MAEAGFPVAGTRAGRSQIEILTSQRAGTLGVTLATAVLRPAIDTASQQLGRRLAALAGTRAATGAARALLADPIAVVTNQYRPLPANSALGASAFYLALLILMCGFLAGTIVHVSVDAALGYATTEFGPRWRQAQPLPISRLRTLLVKWTIGWAVTAATSGLMLAVAVGAMGTDAPHPVLLWLYSWLCSASVAAGTIVLFAVLGTPGQMVAILVFIYAGLASAGGIVPLEALPAFLRWLSQVEPLRQILAGTRAILYFDAAGAAGLTRGVYSAGAGLLFWLVVGLLVVRWYDRRRLYRMHPELLAYVGSAVRAYRDQHGAAVPARSEAARSFPVRWLLRAHGYGAAGPQFARHLCDAGRGAADRRGSDHRRRWLDRHRLCTGVTARERRMTIWHEHAGGDEAQHREASTADVGAIDGRLRSVLDLRSDQHVQERAIVIEHRSPLVYMLCAAAELEHALMCEYLFAAFSLKRSVDEGLRPEQLAAVDRWRATILTVAQQEMLHLAIACNLLTSIGVSPHLSRPNLPQPARHYPSGVRLELLPFGEQALRHFLFLERPEGMDLDDAEGLAALENAIPVMGEEEIAPHLQEFRTVGHLYRSIEAGFRHLAEKLGEQNLFLGPPGSQVKGELFGWNELGPVSTVDEAVAAIEAIVEMGEGPRGDWRDAHFGRFLAVLTEYLQMREAAPGVEVTRPVLPVLVRPPETGAAVPLVTDPTTARVADLCNVTYEVLLHLLYRLISHIDESDDQIGTLANVAVGLMSDVIGPLADILSTMPVGPEHPGRTAGATFELFYQPDYLLPHREAAWLVTAEMLAGAASSAESEAQRDPRLATVASVLRSHAEALREKSP